MCADVMQESCTTTAICLCNLAEILSSDWRVGGGTTTIDTV